MKAPVIYCRATNKFQSEDGIWHDAGENKEYLSNHLHFQGQTEDDVIDGVYDETNDTAQITIEFEEP